MHCRSLIRSCCNLDATFIQQFSHSFVYFSILLNGVYPNQLAVWPGPDSEWRVEPNREKSLTESKRECTPATQRCLEIKLQKLDNTTWSGSVTSNSPASLKCWLKDTFSCLSSPKQVRELCYLNAFELVVMSDQGYLCYVEPPVCPFKSPQQQCVTLQHLTVARCSNEHNKIHFIQFPIMPSSLAIFLTILINPWFWNQENFLELNTPWISHIQVYTLLGFFFLSWLASCLRLTKCHSDIGSHNWNHEPLAVFLQNHTNGFAMHIFSV